jgi:TonB family protein
LLLFVNHINKYLSLSNLKIKKILFRSRLNTFIHEYVKIMKKFLFLVLISLIAINCTYKTKNPKTAKSEITIKKNDSSQLPTIYSESNFEEHDVNPGPIDTASFIFEYYNVEKAPLFPGGKMELLEFISKHLKYPVRAKDIDLQGQVICRIIVSKTGKVEKCEVVRSLDRVCDNEALRVLKTLPRFIPGKLKGKNVNVWYTIPVTFTLE